MTADGVHRVLSWLDPPLLALLHRDCFPLYHMYHVQAEPYSLLGPVDERLRRLGPHRTVSKA